MSPRRRVPPDTTQQHSVLLHLRTFTSLSDLRRIREDPDWCDFTHSKEFLAAIPWLSFYCTDPPALLQCHYSELSASVAAGIVEAMCVRGVLDLFVTESDPAAGLMLLARASDGGLTEALYFYNLHHIFETMMRGNTKISRYIKEGKEMATGPSIPGESYWRRRRFPFPLSSIPMDKVIIRISNTTSCFLCAAAKLPKVFHGDQRHQKDTFIYINQVFGAVCLSASSSKLDDDHLRTKLLPHEETGFNPVNIEQLSWKPRAFLLKGFLSDDECDHLIKLAKDHLEKSMVADNESGKSVMSTVRTSSGYFLQSGHDEIVTRIENRIAAVTFLPRENAETIHILHYKIGEKYEPHFDYFHDETNKAMGGHRYATVLMYLSDVKKGGETVFPNAEDWERQVKDDSYSDCAKKGFAVKPKKGDALLFYSLHVNTTTDPLSMHGSCAVIEGEKWSATRWIHVRPFAPTPAEDTTGSCVDTTKSCSGWAAIGECQKNPKYMLSYCKKSCNSC